MRLHHRGSQTNIDRPQKKVRNASRVKRRGANNLIPIWAELNTAMF